MTDYRMLLAGLSPFTTAAGVAFVSGAWPAGLLLGLCAFAVALLLVRKKPGW